MGYYYHENIVDSYIVSFLEEKEAGRVDIILEKSYAIDKTINNNKVEEYDFELKSKLELLDIRNNLDESDINDDKFFELIINMKKRKIKNIRIIFN